MTRLFYLRIGLATMAMAVVAISASAIFDSWVWEFPVSILIPAVVAAAVRPLPLLPRIVFAVVAVVAAVGVSVLLAGGDLGDAAAALTSGPQRLLTTEWPSPSRPDLIGAVTTILAIATALACDLAGRRRWHLLPLAPVALAATAVTALSAPGGHHLLVLIPLGLIAAAFAALRPDDASLKQQLATLGGERRLLPTVLVAAAVATVVSISMSLAVRADPRRNEPAAQTASLLDPIESTIAMHDLEPVIDLHEITIVSDQAVAVPRRWRTAALSNYDGQRWTPEVTLRPIGRRLGPAQPDSLSVAISFLDDSTRLVPLSGAPITVDASIETDPDRTVVRLAQRPDASPIDVTAMVAPTLADADTVSIATRPVDESETNLSEFAIEIAGDGTVLEQLQRIESTMRDTWVLESDAPGGGLQRTLIERFVRDTQRGNAEQFATAYVLLARSLGVDARVATGFVAPDLAVSPLVLTSRDAAVWPEVRLVEGGWVAFDPVPTEEATDVAPPPEQPATQTPAAAQPPAALPPEVGNDSTDVEESTDDEQATTLSALRRWGTRAAFGLVLLILPLLIGVLLIVVAKRRRRRLLLRGSPQTQVRGAWALATDRLVDAGLDIEPSATNGDIATKGTPLAVTAGAELHSLAQMSSAVTFGDPPRPDLLARRATSYLGTVESEMKSSRSRTERLKWLLSLRSLRNATRSPVAD